MTDFPRTLTDTVAIGADTAAIGAVRFAFDVAGTYEAGTEWVEDFSGDLSAYEVDGDAAIASGVLTTIVDGWGDLQLEPHPVQGPHTDVTFDFWVPAYSDPVDTYFGYEVDGDRRYAYLDNSPLDGAAGEWGVYPGSDEFYFTPDPSSWYRARFSLGGYEDGDVAAAKVWKVGDPEPEWQFLSVYSFSAFDPGVPPLYVYLSSEGSGVVEAAQMDNILWHAPTLTDVAEAPEFASHRLFNIGTASTLTERTFDIEGPPASLTTHRRFDIAGSISARTERIFDIEGAVRVNSGRLFNIESESADMDGTDEIGAYINQPAVSTTLTDDADPGDTTLTVASTTGLSPGSYVSVGGETLVVATVTSGTVVTLASPVTVGAASGTFVNTASGFVPGLYIFDKAGLPLGVLTRYTITQAPTMMIGAMGSFGFFISRLHPQAALIQQDRLVAFQFRLGATDMWAGNIEVDESASSVISVMAPDVFSLLTGAPIVVEQDLLEAVPASTVYKAVIDATNQQKVADTEITWALSAAGATNLFYGALEYDEDPLDAIGDVANRSDTEFRSGAVITGGRLALTLYATNEFRTEGAAAIFDGPGGNVASDPRWVRDSAPIVNGLRLQGLAGSIAKYLPDWAQWAAQDVTPESTIFVDTLGYRRRVDSSINVGFGMSPTALKGIADQILELLWGMYFSFLYAYHETYGRPYHEGWSYEGPPSDIEPFLHTGNDWRTKLKIIEIKGQPASMVMHSKREQQILAVTYNRVTGAYRARRYWASEATGGAVLIVKLRLHGRLPVFLSEGGVLYERNLQRFDHSSFTMSPSVVRMRFDTTDADGKAVTTWHNVRRVIALSETLEADFEGRWMEMIPTIGPTNTSFYTRPVVGEAPYFRLTVENKEEYVDFDSAFITKVFEAERGRIRDWDPRRDGVGVYRNKRSVNDNQPTTKPRWVLTPFGVGVDGTTSLTTGISATATTIYVDSVFSMPRLQAPALGAAGLGGAATAIGRSTTTASSGPPWDGTLQIGLDPVAEIVKVTAIVGNAMTVRRGQNGTTAIIHEAGTQTKALNVTESSVFQHLWDQLDWTEGDAYAQRLLEKLRKPFIRCSLEVSNRGGMWSKVQLGTVHPVTLETEGAGTITGEARCVGISPDSMTGRMEVILEWQTD